MKKLLWIGDAGVQTGFARCTHNILNTLKDHFDLEVLALNYRGDPHNLPFKLYPAGVDWGVARTLERVAIFQPDIVVIQQDPWNIPEYLKKIAATEHSCTIIGVMAVDGKNCRGNWLNGLDLGIFWTQFGLDEARAGGFTKPGVVIPLGIDLEQFNEADKLMTRKLCTLLPPEAWNGFIVGAAGRNQPRKRMDLTMQYFAEWMHTYNHDDAWLFMHSAPTGDAGYDLEQLARYYGISHRFIVSQPSLGYGVPEKDMRLIYSMWDLGLFIPQGEGWGLMVMEAMACRVACAVSHWSALAEWAQGGVYPITCTSTATTPMNINAIGGIADRSETIETLELFYQSGALRESIAEKGLNLVSADKFKWDNIGTSYLMHLSNAHHMRTQDAAELAMKDTVTA